MGKYQQSNSDFFAEESISAFVSKEIQGSVSQTFVGHGP